MFNLGLRALARLVEDGDNLAFIKAKLSPRLFKPGDELAAFEFVHQHVQKYQSLPKPETLLAAVPAVAEATQPEKAAYYLDLLLNRYEYEVIGDATVAAKELLTKDRSQTQQALALLNAANKDILGQRYRHQIMDFGAEGAKYVITNYFGITQYDLPLINFGWPYLDRMVGNLLPGDLVSYVGRPAAGKTWFMLFTALHNWRVNNRNVMFVSMEMNHIHIAQRLAAMYTHSPYDQLKKSQMATATFNAFNNELKKLGQEPSKLYVVNGNLMAEVEELYALAEQLDIELMVIDGAYLLRHPNRRLNRFERVAENVELIKKIGEQTEIVSATSWQFAKTAAKKNKKKGEKADLEDIGYSDAIAQTSSIVAGLMQEETVETHQQRIIDVLKGRAGETGRFSVNWRFNDMDFSEVSTEPRQLEFL